MFKSEMPAATLRILGRNLESNAFNDFESGAKLQLSQFSIEYIHQGNPRIEYARRFFPDAQGYDFIIEREYPSIPKMPGDYVGYGAIVLEPEDLLSSLRLYRPGDLAFVGVSIQRTGRPPVLLYPYRVISNLVTESTRQFTFNREDVQAWEDFDRGLRSSPSWTASWFKAARRAFLYGSSDEFNPNFEGQVDRVSYFFAALEASLVPKSDFIQRSLKERAIALLGANGDSSTNTKKLLSDFYGIRSTLVHGSPLSPRQIALLQDRGRWWEFELLVRELLVAAVKTVPPDEKRRKDYLSALYEPGDAAHSDEVVKHFKSIKDDSVRKSLVAHPGPRLN